MSVILSFILYMKIVHGYLPVLRKKSFPLQRNEDTARLTNRNNLKTENVMKHLLLVLVMFSALNAAAADTAPRHRHQHVDAALVQPADSANSVEAYSDTTTYETYDDEPEEAVSTPARSVSPSDYSDPFSFYNALWTVGVGGVIIAILLTLLFLVLILAPVAIVVVLIRYLFKSHNDRMMLREKAMERGYARGETAGAAGANASGQPEYSPADYEKMRDDYMLKRGIQNVAVGMGLVIMFGCWGAEFLVGIGFLVVCLGVGQIVISRLVPGVSGKRGHNSDVKVDIQIPKRKHGRDRRRGGRPDARDASAEVYDETKDNQ